MAKRTTQPKQIEQYEHSDKDRLNNPPVGLVSDKTDTEYGQKKKKYKYDPHLDPQLQWTGKTEHTSFEIPTVSLHVHERIDPKTIIDTVKKEGAKHEQMSLFEQQEKPLREAIEFYKHKEDWTNRLIAGDSLLVMNSLLEKEGMAGKVQMVFFDPPYGINYRSNFQPFTNKRDVKDTDKDEDLTSEPEMLRAFRDTWEIGIHSYLTYLRDRLKLVKEMLANDGSVFVQIGAENVHLVRMILDEVFGVKNFYSQISFRKKMMPLSKKPGCEHMNDYLLWYAKNKEKAFEKINQLFIEQNPFDNNSIEAVELEPYKRRQLTSEEKSSAVLPNDAKLYQTMPLKPREYRTNQDFNIEFNSKLYAPMGGDVNNTPDGVHCWSTTKIGLERIKKANRLEVSGNYLRYVLFHDDYPVTRLTANWNDTAPATGMRYVVETSKKVIARCISMATGVGDLVLDITCGSGATAQEAERLGRRWITCDSSRIALTIAKQNLITRQYDYYKLRDNIEGISSGFIYSKVAHITSGSIANNKDIDKIWDEYIGKIESLIAKINERTSSSYSIYNIPYFPQEEWDPEENSELKDCWSLINKMSQSINSSIDKFSSQEILYDKPILDTSKIRVTGPFTVESIPAPFVKDIEGVIETEMEADISISRTGETLRQDQWRDELQRSGVRAKGGAMIVFNRIEALSGTKYIQAF